MTKSLRNCKKARTQGVSCPDGIPNYALSANHGTDICCTQSCIRFLMRWSNVLPNSVSPDRGRRTLRPAVRRPHHSKSRFESRGESATAYRQCPFAKQEHHSTRRNESPSCFETRHQH